MYVHIKAEVNARRRKIYLEQEEEKEREGERSERIRKILRPLTGYR